MNRLEKEIIEFKKEVLNSGMQLDTYLNKRKEFINKIDYTSERNMKFFMYLLHLDMITRQQYLDAKIKVDNFRKRYKSMLAII